MSRCGRQFPAATHGNLANFLRNCCLGNTDAPQVVIVNGSQQSWDLIARVLLEPGDSVAIEDPGYQGRKSSEYRSHALSARGLIRVCSGNHPKLYGPAYLPLDRFKRRELGQKSEITITMPHRNFVFHGNGGDQTIVGRTDGKSATAALAIKIGSG